MKISTVVALRDALGDFVAMLENSQVTVSGISTTQGQWKATIKEAKEALALYDKEVQELK